ncbi:hypothetical protein BHE74_00057072 [Ensete ventricosum]|nr:hypothetical protein BHE74_00057072 [Ensete ventricosum]
MIHYRPKSLTSVYEIPSYLQVKIGHKVNQNRATKPTTSPPLAVQGSDDAVRNSPGVRRELVEGIRSLLGWHKGVHRKKTETRRKIVVGSRKTCRDLGIGLRMDDTVGARREFARTSPKVSGRSPRTR